MRLLHWQQGIQARITRGQHGIDVQIATSGGIEANTRLRVYAEAYELRLLDVLREDFRILDKALGKPGFDHLARAYISAQPSETASIRWFGRHFAEFLHQQDTPTPWAAELAAFEWAQGEVVDAADAEVCNADALASLSPEAWPDLRLRLHPSLRRLDLQWNVPALWQVVSEHKARTVTAPCSRQPQAWMLWRRGLDIHWRSMPAIEAKLMALASRSANCADLCALMHTDGVHVAEVAPSVAGLYKRWLNDGWISELRTD